MCVCVYIYIFFFFFFKVEKQIGECASICKQLFVEFQVGSIHLLFSVFKFWIFIEMHYVVYTTSRSAAEFGYNPEFWYVNEVGKV